MYQNILVPVENSVADQTILEHVRSLARLTKAKLCLLHVADGWVARNYQSFALRESEEMKKDREYLETLRGQLTSEGFTVEQVLALGDPVAEIIKVAEEKQVDLIAMSTHGHSPTRLFLLGSVTYQVVRHSPLPVLVIRSETVDTKLSALNEN